VWRVHALVAAQGPARVTSFGPGVCTWLAAGSDFFAQDITLASFCVELLYGDRDGVFIFEKQAKITTKTADGVVSAREGSRRMMLPSAPCAVI
jgi:hypothetical protein